jgi:hypothetical protein
VCKKVWAFVTRLGNLAFSEFDFKTFGFDVLWRLGLLKLGLSKFMGLLVRRITINFIQIVLLKLSNNQK